MFQYCPQQHIKIVMSISQMIIIPKKINLELFLQTFCGVQEISRE